VRVKILIRHSSGKKAGTYEKRSQDRRHPDHKSDAVLPELTWTKESLWYSAISYGNIGPHADMPRWYRFKPIRNVGHKVVVHGCFGDTEEC
jgi:hypothetical protein